LLTIERTVFKHNEADDRGEGEAEGGGIFFAGSGGSVRTTRFCENTPEHIFGSYSDGGGNEYSDDCPCTGDADGDGFVGAGDILVVLGSWGDGGGPADFNGDGIVDVADLLIVLSAWGPCPGGVGACRFVDGSCIEATAADCTFMSGSYDGNGTDCSDL
jgi:hypothetical protein